MFSLGLLKVDECDVISLGDEEGDENEEDDEDDEDEVQAVQKPKGSSIT